MTTLINNSLLSVITIIGLIVLVALNKVTADVAVPVIIGLTGVHVGANVSGTNTPPALASAPKSMG